MTTLETVKESHSEDLSRQALTMALAILVDRIRRLPDDDRADLFQLVMGLSKAGSADETESIVVAMREILEQQSIRIRAMDQTSDTVPGESLRSWINHLSDRIRTYRKQAGMTQEQLAEKSGLPQSHISRLENGQHSPSRITLERIAAALGFDVSAFDLSA